MAPEWLEHARSKIGTAEVPGPGFNPWIKNLWLGLRGGTWFWSAYGQDDSKLPWCGAFCAWAVLKAGHVHPAKYASALAWLGWGEPCGPELGAVAVMRRKGGGHVGFVDAVTPDGQYVRLVGGNQNDKVSAAWFSFDRIEAYRKPPGAVLVAAATLPLGTLSTSQA